MATAKQLDDITECPICTEVYTDPRVLPCVHTYCLKCIEEWSEDLQPGDELACPLCRKEFTLPSNGVADLPKNFFVTKFLQMKELFDGTKERPCEACSGGEESEPDAEVRNVASLYCAACQMKLCHNCERAHKAIKSTRSHKIIIIGEKVSTETRCQSMPPSYCDQHKDENLKIYCFDCKLAICMMCFIKSHNGHNWSDINEVVGEFREQMKSDVDKIAAGVKNCREILQSVEKEKNHFIGQVAQTRNEIDQRAQELKQMIDIHREKIMNELSSVTQNRMKEIDSLREEIETRLLSMESYKKYVDEMREKGTPCDIAIAASSLHDRADELSTFHVTGRTLADLGHVDVMFTSSGYVIDDINETFGQLRLTVIENGEFQSTLLQGALGVYPAH